MFKKLRWETKGININGSYLSLLKYTDDTILFSQSSTELQEMVQEMHVASEKIGLQMTINKTKIMTNTGENINIKINGERLEQVEEYVYLGQTIKLNRENQEAEIVRRIKLSWAEFGKLRDKLENKKHAQHKKQEY